MKNRLQTSARAMSTSKSYFNLGLYTVPEASRLLRKSRDWVTRTLFGYHFKHGGAYRETPALVRAQVGRLDSHPVVTFLDLIEMLFIRDFMRVGFSIYEIKKAAHSAADLYGDVDHPFANMKFRTDGVTILAMAKTDSDDPKMIDLISRQHMLSRVMEPFIKQLAYDDSGTLERWYPMGPKRHVVLDPRISFGRPVVKLYSVPIDVLAAAVKSGQKIGEVADWYELPVRAVRDAVEYHAQLAA